MKKGFILLAVLISVVLSFQLTSYANMFDLDNVHVTEVVEVVEAVSFAEPDITYSTGTTVAEAETISGTVNIQNTYPVGKHAVVIMAAYDSTTGLMKEFAILHNNELAVGANSIPITSFNVEGADMVKVFAFDDLDTIVPYTEPQIIKTESLDGKKIIFIGNSFTYYGKTVIDPGNIVDKEVMATRFDDKGYFYQLCKQNGANVTVTNWTWGGHTLNDTFGGKCNANRGHNGHDHLADLRNFGMYYDYVIIQPGSADTAESAKSGIKEIQDIFKAANPNVKFIYNIHPRYYLRGNEDDKALIAKIGEIAEELNLDVANWGVLVNDIIKGVAVVENTTLDYNQNTFIITKSATDGYHPNMLSGYITTQMIYSVLTGEKALGEDYSFCTDTTINDKFSVKAFLKSYYTYDNISAEGSGTKLTGDELTTFPEVFKSPSDMKGIQKLIDEYIKVNK